MYRVYFASPFFTSEQVEREERLKKKLRELGFEVWSPKENSLCKPDASAEVRKSTFSDNLKNIQTCDIIFVVTDGKDVGTIWEAGYAYGLNAATWDATIKIVYYCETLNGGKFNLMLAQSGDVVITEFEQLDSLKDKMNRGAEYHGYIE